LLKPRRKRCVGYVACTERRIISYNTTATKYEGIRLLGTAMRLLLLRKTETYLE
jgi:hypothetical protein